MGALTLIVGLAIGLATPVSAQTGDASGTDWEQTLREAQGQTVYWNAWAGDQRTNAFIQWVGEQTEARFDVAIRHVKLSDTAEAVTRVVTEKAAGRDENGSVDLLWINGPNFLSM